MNSAGIDFENCKYIFTQSSDEVGTNIASYASGTQITSATTQIEQALGPGETWFLHVLAADKAGNKIEKISENSIEIESTAEFPYTGSEQTANLLPGKYKLECWGAQGGVNLYTYGKTAGGFGGYGTGNINLNKPQNLYIYVGAKGKDGGGKTAFAYNGGGRGEYSRRRRNSYCN